MLLATLDLSVWDGHRWFGLLMTNGILLAMCRGIGCAKSRPCHPGNRLVSTASEVWAYQRPSSSASSRC